MQNNNKKHKPAKSAANPKKKKKNTAMPQNKKPIICPPDRSGMSLRVRILGYICRAAIIFTAVYALVFFVCDALRLEAQEITVSAGFIALICLLSVALFSLMRLTKYGFLAGLAVCAGALVIFLSGVSNVVTFITQLALTAKNVVLTRLYNLGYYSMIKYMSSVSYSGKYTAEYYFKCAVALLAILLSLIFVLSVLKRVRVLIPALISTALILGVFTYNISRSNWGVALIIASFTGLLVMAAYDNIFSAKSDPGKYDTETFLFDYADRPAPPSEDLSAASARFRRRRAKREYRALKAQRKKEKKLISVDEELTAYFKTSVKKDKIQKPKKEEKKKLTPEEKKAHAKARRQSKREAGLLHKYDSAVINSRAAQGGFAAFGVFLIALAMLTPSALTVSGSFSAIKVIDEKMEEYREYITALLMGNDPILDELGYENNKNNFEPHSTLATPQVYTGAKIFTVETSYAANVYLRGWIGVDYKNGAWYAVNEEQLEAYRELYGTSDDPSEALFSSFYSFMNPSAITDKDYIKNHTSNTKYGFVTMQVNLSRIKTGDTLVYMPAFYRVSEDIKAARLNGFGLYEFESNTPLETSFVNYFDGIYTGRKFANEISYAAVANVTAMKNVGWYKNVADYIADFMKGYSDAHKEIAAYAARKASGKPASLDDIVKNIFTSDPGNVTSFFYNVAANTKTLCVEYPLGIAAYVYTIDTGELISKSVIQLTPWSYIDPDTGEEVFETTAFIPPELSLEIRYREVMTDDEKYALADAYYRHYLYSEFVYDTYLNTAGSRIVSDMLTTILSETDTANDFALAAGSASPNAETYEQRHELIMAIVDYMKENYTYTLEPTAPTNAGLDGIENFLTVTKEGYCVQFASALTLLLREAGIPARFVEGYVACDFYKTRIPGTNIQYSATVRDYNAHAWVEVWFDGVGWVQYEATPVYYDDMYVRTSGEGSVGVTRPWETETDEMSEEEMLLEGLLSSINLADDMVETMLGDIKLLIGSGDVRSALEGIAGEITRYRDRWQEQSDYYALSGSDDEYSSSYFIFEIQRLQNNFESEITEGIDYQRARIESLESFNKLIWIIAASLAALCALIIFLVIISSKAKKAERKRVAELERIIIGGFTDEELHPLSRRTIDHISSLLTAYGTPPNKGEFRDEYAERLAAEYADLFESADELKSALPQKTPADHMSHMLESMAAEEFGFGMTHSELREIAVFTKRLRTKAKHKMKLRGRISAHYIKRII